MKFRQLCGVNNDIYNDTNIS